MSVIEVVRWVHLGVGALVFLVLPVPLLARKGGRAHVRFGRVYAYAMAVMVATGVPLAARGLASPNDARRANALFLFYIALLAAESSWSGVHALRTAGRPPGSRRAIEMLPSALVLAGALALLVVGLARGVVLHVFFGLLGASLGATHLSFWRRERVSRSDSMVAHIGGMGVSVIVTLTAFLVTNARYLFGLRAFTAVVWITPAVLGGLAIARAQRRWRVRAMPVTSTDVDARPLEP